MTSHQLDGPALTVAPTLREELPGSAGMTSSPQETPSVLFPLPTGEDRGMLQPPDCAFFELKL